MSADRFSILAIDPGLSGALAFYYPDAANGTVKVYDMPRVADEIDPAELSRIISEHSPTVAVIERVGPMPRDGVRQAWRFSAAYTTAHVVCALLNVPTTRITPAKWKREVKVKGGPEGKEQCRALAIQLFPTCAASFARKKDAGRAEAALLAHYAHQTLVYNHSATRT